MSETEELMRRAAGMSAVRRVMMVLNGLTYSVWMVGLAMTTGTSAGATQPFWAAVQMGGLLAWLISLAGVVWTVFEARRRRELAVLIDDERTAVVTTRTFVIGYVLLLFPLAGIYTASYFTEVDIRFVIPIMLAIGVAAPTIGYAILSRN